MATQAQMIMDTVLGMKRVLAQEEDSTDTEDPYLQPPNRGNKLKRKARYMADGRPAKKKGRETYTTKIEHAGYQRDILRRNPKRYDEDGDELDPEDEDEDADARAAEDNPYADIHLESLLAPLTSAANLVEHPSLSAPYLSSTLSNMAQHACDTMHRERKTLRSAKLLLRKLRGDEVWIPTHAMNAAVDVDIFDTDKVFNRIIAETSTGKTNGIATANGSVNGDAVSRTVSGSATGEGINSVEAIAAQEHNPVKEATENLAPEEPEVDDAADVIIENTTDAKMPDADNQLDSMDGPETFDTSDVGNAHHEDTVVTDGLEMTDTRQLPKMNGTKTAIEAGEPAGKTADIIGESTHKVSSKGKLGETIEVNTDALQDGATGNNFDPEVMDEDADSNQAPEPRRMRTRAQAQAASEPAVSSHTASPDPPYIPPPIHPLFLLPASAKPNPDYGLPPQEAEETRRMLMVYVQKQEEVCRSAEKLHQNLLRADRERVTVLRWCKAEGHVGEMSDGEDWCDKEEWGLDEDLRKGEGDEKEGDDAAAGKKTRGRRA